MKKTDRLVICSAWQAPDVHWSYDDLTHDYIKKSGRRSAGYIRIANTKTDGENNVNVHKFVPIVAVNDIRTRVNRWRNAGYPGVTSVTRELLEHWKDDKRRDEPLFFCQLEAIETIIWMTEADPSERRGISLESDGGPFCRYCSKMATGSGKTVVMAMLITWQTLNSVYSPDDDRYSKDFLLVAPGLTVKERLQVLRYPDRVSGYYRRYSLVPDSMREQLKRSTISIHNWHTLVPFDDETGGVVRKGIEDDEAFAWRVLGHDRRDIVVINDEAHHAWRRPSEMDPTDLKGEQKTNEKIATLWVGGLDKIHRGRGILTCYDFTATPFVPTGKKATDEALFGWIISDFSLGDAIESGLVKTPCPPAGDTGLPVSPDGRSKYYHLFSHEVVQNDLTSRAAVDKPLPDIVRNAYLLLARDWQQSMFEFGDSPTPPVMLTVCNLTRTAARVENFFKNEPYDFGNLVDDDGLLRIDSNVLKAERGEKLGNKIADDLRAKASTVGKEGEPGEHVKNIIAVSMLSEGWDANNVTQIMGLRAFTSQLLCEQVIGRGLRRQSYEPGEDGLLAEEYVSVMGVPFSLVPRTTAAPATKKRGGRRRQVFADPLKSNHEISWPNVARVEVLMRPTLEIDMDKAKTLEISAKDVDMTVTVAPMLEEMRPMVDRASEITLCDALEQMRLQTVIFHTVRDVYRNISAPRWGMDAAMTFVQLEDLTEEFIHSGKIRIVDIADELEVKKSLALAFNMKTVVEYVCSIIRSNTTTIRRLVFKPGGMLRSTEDMQPWYTRRDVASASKSHLNCAPCDSSWEQRAALELDTDGRVESWVKTDRLGFVIGYAYEGTLHEYRPDYLIRLRGQDGKKTVMLVLEVKGQRTPQSDAKHDALREWVDAVNEDRRFGHWAWDVAYHPDRIVDILRRHCPA